MEENAILPPAGPLGNFRFTCTEFSEMLFPNNLPLMHSHNAQIYRLAGLSFGEVIELFVFVAPPPPIPPALFSPGRWASGGLSEGFMWVGCPGGVQTLVQWMSRQCGGSVTRLHTDGPKMGTYKRDRGLYCRLFRESTSLRGWRTNTSQSG